MPTSESDVRGYTQLPDEALVLHISRRSSEALAALYDRHAQPVYNLILRIVREPASADEILQDTFWQVWQKADTYQQGNAAAWLYRIARNKSLDWLRRQKTQPPAAFSLDAQDGAETAAAATAAVAAAVTLPVEQVVAQSWQQEVTTATEFGTALFKNAQGLRGETGQRRVLSHARRADVEVLC